jgi:hypothetical protein
MSNLHVPTVYYIHIKYGLYTFRTLQSTLYLTHFINFIIYYYIYKLYIYIMQLYIFLLFRIHVNFACFV